MEGQEQNYLDDANASGYRPPETDHGVKNGKSKETLNSIMIFSVGFFAIVFGGASMWFSVSNPFDDLLKIGQEQAQKLAERQKAEVLAMQSIDTDGDGLSDYLELNKYGTSPYLKDSDGDGIDDKTEIERGTDPNCPEGQNCFNSNYQNQGLATADYTPTLNTSAPTSKLQVTPEFIRQIMKQNGTSDEELAEISDQELLDGFVQFLQENPDALSALEAQGYALPGTEVATTQPTTNSVDLSAVNVKSTEDLKNLTGAQIRQLMIDSGASVALLSAISDEQLKTMFVEQINSRSASIMPQPQIQRI